MENVYDYRNYFYNLHDIEVNQKYDKDGACVPYSFHLRMAEKQAEKFKHLIPSDKYPIVLIGVMGHDSIEDARLTFNDVKNYCGEEIAEIVIACTERWGHNRSERHSLEYYEYLKKNKLAIFVKLCDIIANVKYSLLSNSSMFKKYKTEYIDLKKHLYCVEYNEMFDYLEKILNID